MNQVYAAQGASLLPEHGLYGFQEILYASAEQYWGVAGLWAFTLIMVSPVILLVADTRVMRSQLQRAALKGLIIYIVMAGIDGALDFIPVMAFYWFVYAVFLYGWPGDRPILLPDQSSHRGLVGRLVAGLNRRLSPRPRSLARAS